MALTNRDTGDEGGWVGAENWIVAALRGATAEKARLGEENGRLRAALAFAASCIKAGLPWTPECEERIGELLKGER